MSAPRHVVPQHGGRGGSGVNSERDRITLGRQLLLGRYLDPWGPTEIVWCHSATIIRGHKVILNLYDLLPPRFNGCLSITRLGGAYHSGIQVASTEYAFGGHPNDDLGITALQRPLFELRRQAEETVSRGQDEDGAAAASLDWMPTLHSRTVVGWWMGPLAEVEAVLCQLRFEELWIGSGYQLLSRNCNHFARAMCGVLLRSPFFKPAPGRTSADKMVPPTITRLSNLVLMLASCAPCIRRRLNTPMPLPPHALSIFQGQPRRIGPDGLAASLLRARSDTAGTAVGGRDSRLVAVAPISSARSFPVRLRSVNGSEGGRSGGLADSNLAEDQVREEVQDRRLLHGPASASASTLQSQSQSQQQQGLEPSGQQQQQGLADGRSGVVLTPAREAAAAVAVAQNRQRLCGRYQSLRIEAGISAADEGEVHRANGGSCSSASAGASRRPTEDDPGGCGGSHRDSTPREGYSVLDLAATPTRGTTVRHDVCGDDGGGVEQCPMVAALAPASCLAPNPAARANGIRGSGAVPGCSSLEVPRPSPLLPPLLLSDAVLAVAALATPASVGPPLSPTSAPPLQLQHRSEHHQKTGYHRILPNPSRSGRRIFPDSRVPSPPDVEGSLTSVGSSATGATAAVAAAAAESVESVLAALTSSPGALRSLGGQRGGSGSGALDAGLGAATSGPRGSPGTAVAPGRRDVQRQEHEQKKRHPQQQQQQKPSLQLQQQQPLQRMEGAGEPAPRVGAAVASNNRSVGQTSSIGNAASTVQAASTTAASFRAKAASSSSLPRELSSLPPEARDKRPSLDGKATPSKPAVKVPLALSPLSIAADADAPALHYPPRSAAACAGPVPATPPARPPTPLAHRSPITSPTKAASPSATAQPSRQLPSPHPAAASPAGTETASGAAVKAAAPPGRTPSPFLPGSGTTVVGAGGSPSRAPSPARQHPAVRSPSPVPSQRHLRRPKPGSRTADGALAAGAAAAVADPQPHRPWSVLSGGFVDLLFARSARNAAEPPPGVPPDATAAAASIASLARATADGALSAASNLTAAGSAAGGVQLAGGSSRRASGHNSCEHGTGPGSGTGTGASTTSSSSRNGVGSSPLGLVTAGLKARAGGDPQAITERRALGVEAMSTVVAGAGQGPAAPASGAAGAGAVAEGTAVHRLEHASAKPGGGGAAAKAGAAGATASRSSKQRMSPSSRYEIMDAVRQWAGTGKKRATDEGAVRKRSAREGA